jgi:hypothetical protein
MRHSSEFLLVLLSAPREARARRMIRIVGRMSLLEGSSAPDDLGAHKRKISNERKTAY